MKLGASLWTGAGAVVLLAATLHWLARREPAAQQTTPVPVATPPGITLQVRAASKKAPGAAAPEVVYADATGMTLYVHDGSIQPSKSGCTDNCANVWAPAVAPPAATQTGAWSLIVRPDRTKQWAYRGAPLYRFRNDKAIGDTKGDGADGGAWHVAAFRPGSGMILPDDIAVRDIVDVGGAGLVDYLGMTLYTFDGDTMHPMPSCNGGDDCARHWLPLEAPVVAHAAGEFSVITREDGITQWGFRGKPLYEFDGDQQPSDARGSRVDARFHVALIVRYFMPTDATIRPNAELGDILTTASGTTLYQRDRVIPGEGHGFRTDHGSPELGRSFGTVTCDERCARAWPPFIAPADALPSGYWEIAKRPGGTRQWVYKGFALYTYARDKPGDTSGNESYDLAEIGDDPIVPAEGNDPTVKVGGAGGGGVGAMLWHAVVP